MMDGGEAMFEDSLMESGNRTKRRNKFWSFVAFLLNAGALLALVVWPLLHPDALPRQMMATLMVAPSPPPAPPPAAPAPKARMKSELLSKELQVPSTNLRVISGPPMLQPAAMDAVRSWRYKPYLLNGEPVEVETTINVVFNLGE
jgi:Gram-negative bacterial TonB protein C-terminal